MNRDEVTRRLVKAMKHHNFMAFNEFEPTTDKEFIDRATVLILMSLEFLDEQPTEYYRALLTKAMFPQRIIDIMLRDADGEKYELFY